MQDHNRNFNEAASISQAKDPRICCFIDDVKTFFQTEFKNEKAFALIYGSYAYGLESEKSDLDIMFVADDCNSERMKRCINFVLNLHEKNNLPLDTELKYEHKVLIPSAFLEEAVQGNSFKKEDGSFYIPKIEKTRECLESIELRLRFLNGLMIHRHIFVDGDKDFYSSLCEEAQKSLVRAITAARGHHIITPSLLKELLFSNGKDTGDLYLGFKDQKVQHEYLNELCAAVLNKLSHEGSAFYNGTYFDLSLLQNPNLAIKSTLPISLNNK